MGGPFCVQKVWIIVERNRQLFIRKVIVTHRGVFKVYVCIRIEI